jgi:hypothetical protein
MVSIANVVPAAGQGNAEQENEAAFGLSDPGSFAFFLSHINSGMLPVQNQVRE